MSKTELTTEQRDVLDPLFPPCGPCALCGHPDKRHRVWDSIIGRVSAGDSVSATAEDFGLSVEAVEAVLAQRPYQ